jgi:hypothetical protein
MEDGDVIDAHLQQARIRLSPHCLLSCALFSAWRLLLSLLMIIGLILNIYSPHLCCVRVPCCVVAITLSSEVQEHFLIIRLARPSRKNNPAFFRIGSAQLVKKTSPPR